MLTKISQSRTVATQHEESGHLKSFDPYQPTLKMNTDIDIFHLLLTQLDTFLNLIFQHTPLKTVNTNF